MRLIDADRLKTVIDINMANNEIKAMFNQYVDIQPTVNEWIPVERALPEEEGWYLTVVPNIHMNYYYMACKFDGKFPSDVIAWMPIPTYEVNND